MAQNQKVTAKDILNWNGSDGTIQDLASYLADVLNGDCPIDTARKDILDYKQDQEG